MMTNHKRIHNTMFNVIMNQFHMCKYINTHLIILCTVSLNIFVYIVIIKLTYSTLLLHACLKTIGRAVPSHASNVHMMTS